MLEPIKEWWAGPHVYKIYLVGKQQQNKEIAKSFSGFKLAKFYVWNIQDKKITDVESE